MSSSSIQTKRLSSASSDKLTAEGKKKVKSEEDFASKLSSPLQSSSVKMEMEEGNMNNLESRRSSQTSSSYSPPHSVLNGWLPQKNSLPIPSQVHPKRIRPLNCVDKLTPHPEKSLGKGGIVYWMSRDQRVQDNWSLIYAQELALKHNLPLHVVFNVPSKFLEATIRQFGFMFRGLQEVEEELKHLNIPFHLFTGNPVENVTNFIKNHQMSALVVDFSPVRILNGWMTEIGKILESKKLDFAHNSSSSSSSSSPVVDGIPVYQVDAHNIVPCWVTSNKLEYAARTIRPKIHNALSEYFTEFPKVIPNHIEIHSSAEPATIDWKRVRDTLQVNLDVAEVTWITPGTRGGFINFKDFCKNRLLKYSEKRNDPTEHAQSDMSPYFHFGQVSPQRCAIIVQQCKTSSNKDSVEAFIEESVVRRELSDNFCFYNPNYDTLDGANQWAKETLRQHSNDRRDFIYTAEELEVGATHDDLWNAAQLQMVKMGKLHGFLRMYWAKKILEWTRSPEEALRISILLNDKYNLDGRDPNGYVGCHWSICGTHDQGWAERSIFGKIRFMNYQGCVRKFNVKKFVAEYPSKQSAVNLAKERAAKQGGIDTISNYSNASKIKEQ